MHPLWAAHDRRMARHTWVVRVSYAAVLAVLVILAVIVFSIPEPML